MATQVQFRGGDTDDNDAFRGAAREITVDTQKDTLVVHDGATTGGFPLFRASGGAQDISTSGDVSAADGTFTGDVDIADKIVHTGDTNTAIRFPSADTVTVETGGTEAMRINSSQSLLIGPSTGAATTITSAGAATFAGYINTSNSVWTGSRYTDGVGCQIASSGQIQTRCDTGTWNVWAGFKDGNGTGDITSSITAAGDATFSGTVLTGDYDSGDSSTSGLSLQDIGRVIARRQTGSDVVWLGLHGSNTGSEITAAGDADFAGRVNVGYDAGSATLADMALAAYNSHTGSTIYAQNANAGGKVWQAYNASAETSYITSAGAGVFISTLSCTSLTETASDQRFKKNITDANPQLADVTALGEKLRNWDWTDDAPVYEKDIRFLGLVAQEVESICPGIIHTIPRTKDGAELTPESTDEDGNVTPATYEQVDDSYKTIKTSVLIMKLLGAVTELSAKVAALEAA